MILMFDDWKHEEEYENPFVEVAGKMRTKPKIETVYKLVLLREEAFKLLEKSSKIKIFFVRKKSVSNVRPFLDEILSQVGERKKFLARFSRDLFSQPFSRSAFRVLPPRSIEYNYRHYCRQCSAVTFPPLHTQNKTGGTLWRVPIGTCAKLYENLTALHNVPGCNAVKLLDSSTGSKLN